MKVCIESDRSISDVETVLQKAVKTMQKQRDAQPFEDEYIQKQVQTAENAIGMVLDNMLSEISTELSKQVK